MHHTYRRGRGRGRWRHGHMKGGHGYGRGPRRRRGDVRSAVLALLTERPMHGYEMIQELEERSGGHWRPSAGSIYPTLQLMEDEGLVRAEEVEGKRVFSLTDAGSEKASERGEAKPPWESGTDRDLYGRFRTELTGLNQAAGQVARAGDEAQLKETVEALTETRKKLYRLLAD